MEPPPPQLPAASRRDAPKKKLKSSKDVLEKPVKPSHTTAPKNTKTKRAETPPGELSKLPVAGTKADIELIDDHDRMSPATPVTQNSHPRPPLRAGVLNDQLAHQKRTMIDDPGINLPPKKQCKVSSSLMTSNDTTDADNQQLISRDQGIVPAAPLENCTAQSSEVAPTLATPQRAQDNTDTHPHLPVYAVQDLNPELKTPWSFVGRILARNPIRAYKSWRGSGNLFEVYATDKNGVALRVTIFNEGVDKFYDTLAPGIICSFSTGRIKSANTAFAPRDSTIELSFGGNADIYEVENTADYPEPSLRYTKLADLPIAEASIYPTISGVIVEIGPLRKITTRAGRQTTKRDFLLADDSDAEILCTVWGQLAEEIQESLQGRIILIEDAQISDYNNVRSINVSVGSTVLHEPSTSRTAELQRWFADLSPGHSFVYLHG